MALATHAKGPDFDTVNGGSVILVIPLNREAREWVRHHIDEDTPRLGQGFAVEPRYFASLVEAIRMDGMEVA